MSSPESRHPGDVTRNQVDEAQRRINTRLREAQDRLAGRVPTATKERVTGSDTEDRQQAIRDKYPPETKGHDDHGHDDHGHDDHHGGDKKTPPGILDKAANTSGRLFGTGLLLGGGFWQGMTKLWGWVKKEFGSGGGGGKPSKKNDDHGHGDHGHGGGGHH